MKDLFDQIVDNAIDFLKFSVDELKSNPKQSIINFSNSIELFLKARLAAEHWSLIVTRTQLPNYSKVQSGDFQSVSLSEAAEKLDKTIKSGLTKTELKVFRSVYQHRNKAVHFFHEAHLDKSNSEKLIQRIVKEQLSAWYYLYAILTKRWASEFSSKLKLINEVNVKLKGHHEFLNIIFENLENSINAEVKSGIKYDICPSCSFKSMRHTSSGLNEFYQAECSVCDLKNTMFRSECPDCSEEVIFMIDGYADCLKCGNLLTPDFVAGQIIHDGYHRAAMDGEASHFYASCDECCSHETVIMMNDDTYRCSNCFAFFPNVFECEWCSTCTTTEHEYSYLSGCSQCDGSSGYHRDD